jgi:hypothetical protein
MEREIFKVRDFWKKIKKNEKKRMKGFVILDCKRRRGIVDFEPCDL